MNTNNEQTPASTETARVGSVAGSAARRTTSDAALRLRIIADEDYWHDEWTGGVLREAADEIERLRAGLSKILQGGYAPGADAAHPAIAVARDTIDPKWRARALEHYPPNAKGSHAEDGAAHAP